MPSTNPQFTIWRVLVPLPLGAYDFRALKTDTPALGARVLVPWQGGARVGVVLEVLEDARVDRGLHLKDAIALLDVTPILTADALETLKAVASFALAPLGVVLEDFLPFGLRQEVEHLVRLVPGINTAELPTRAEAMLEWSSAALHDPGLLEFLRSQGLLEEEANLLEPMREVIKPVLEPSDMKLTPKQALALETLQDLGRSPSLAEWARDAGVSSGVVSKLERLGLAYRGFEALAAVQLEFPRTDPAPKVVSLEPNLERVHGGRWRERQAIIAQLIRETKGGVLYLAPARGRLERAFKALGGVRPSAMLHFDLNARERQAVWTGARETDFEVIFGTMMALLAPIKNLKLIVLEEEGSDAWKLQGGSRVFVPDAAKLRSEASGARLVFTGAVPSVESLSLHGMVLEPPRSRIHIVDYANPNLAPEMGPMSHMSVAKESWPLSSALKKVLKQVAERGRQAVLIAPRRGFSALVKCPDCAWLPYCPNCDVPLRFHAISRTLECHQCGHQTTPPKRCPKCDGTVLNPKGPGTQWIQKELEKLLPGTNVYRYDRDQKDDLKAFKRGESGVIVGTTAVLSLEPPPDLALIALTFADTFHTHPDFRSSERFHALLRQLLEWHPTRAPLLLVQTFSGRHPALVQILEHHSSDVFPELELASREALSFPPFSQLAQVQLAGRKSHDAEQAAQKIAALIKDRGATKTELLGPAPNPIPRLRGLYVFNLLVKTQNLERLQHLLEPARRSREGSVRVRIDVNPRNISELIED